MQIKGLGLGVFVALAAAIGCGSSSPAGGTGSGGSTGSGGKGSGGSGSGGTNGGGTFTTSVSSSTPLSGLTPGQATQLCNDFNAYASSTLKPDLCKFTGLFAALFTTGTTDKDLQDACTAAYNDCLTGDGGTSSSTCDPTSVGTQPAACTATVGDATSCLNQSTAVYNQLPSCSSLTAASLASATAADAGASTEPPSCVALDACNGVSSGSGTTN